MGNAYEIVRRARAPERLTASDYIENIFTGFFELHGDRRFRDDKAVIGGVAYLKERPVTVIGIEKGHTTEERSYRSFGSPEPEGYRKALRLMQEADKFYRPVICLVDTAGAFCGIEAEERGQGQAIAENLTAMMALRVPVVSILIGEGGSGGALALAVANRVYMLSSACYSVISPEGCASILFKDASKADIAAESLKLTAADAYRLGVIDGIVDDAAMGKDSFYEEVKTLLERCLDELEAEDELQKGRYERFRRMGNDRRDS